MIRKTTYILLLISLLISCKKSEPEKTDEPKIILDYAMKPSTVVSQKLDEKYIAKEKKEIEHFFDNNFGKEFENLSFLVAKNGQIIYEKYEGFANKEKNTLMSAETPLHLASVSKVLTATAILKMVEANKIDLDQKINTILKGFPYPEVTIRTLLNHRSGLVKYSNYIENNKVWDKTKILTNKDFLSLLIKNKPALDYKTDTHFVYNNTNYALLALVIEKISGLTYPEAMNAIIFEPLGMKNTFVFDYKHPQKKATPSYMWDYRKYDFDYLDAIYGDKNIYSTPRDLLIFNNARNAPNFLRKDLLDQVFKGYSYESKGVKNYGLGIRMNEWPTGQKIFFHNGWWHGNTSAYFTLRKENAVIIALSNKFTRKTYQVKRLSVLFGDYPFELNDTISKED
jgi:CubicO group peptidase (beta-lactamase class C family)